MPDKSWNKDKLKNKKQPTEEWKHKDSPREKIEQTLKKIKTL